MIQINLQKCCYQCSLVFYCLLSQVLVWWLYFPSCTKKQYCPSSCDSKYTLLFPLKSKTKKQPQPQLTVLFDFRALRTNSMNKVFADFSDVLTCHPLFIGSQQSLLIPHSLLCLTSTHSLDLIIVVKCCSRNSLYLLLSSLHRWLFRKNGCQSPADSKIRNELSHWKTCLCPSAVKANYVGLFSDREHVNTSQRGSSHSPCAAFLFMSFNSINGLLSHWTVVAPDFFFSLSPSLFPLSLLEWSICSCLREMPQLKKKNSLVASAPVTFAKLEKGFCWGNSWSGGCVRLSGEFKAMLTLSVQSLQDNWGSAEGIEMNVTAQRSIHSWGCDLFTSQSGNALWCFQSMHL